MDTHKAKKKLARSMLTRKEIQSGTTPFNGFNWQFRKDQIAKRVEKMEARQKAGAIKNRKDNAK